MHISEALARHLVFAIHDAWNVRDIERLLSCYVDDLTFWVNLGDADGGTITTNGKEQFRVMLQAWTPLESLTVPHHFRFEHGVARANVEFYLRDLRSGQSHSSTYRQVTMFRDDKISRVEQYHDAPGLQAFLAIVQNP